jgi:HK97 family phage major capsid protein
VEDLKKELEGLKTDIMQNFEQKSKTDIQSAIAEFETKSKGAYDLEVKNLQAEFEKKSDAMQAHLDKLDLKVNAPGKTEGKIEVKSFNDILAETIEANADAIRTSKKGMAEMNFEMKAVGDMSIGANFPGATPFIQEVRNPMIETPYNRVWLADLLPQGTSSGNSIIYPKENGGEGAAGLWLDPAVDKPQMDFDLTSQSAFFKWIAGIVVVDREMLDDIPFLTSYLQNKMLISLKTAENSFVLNGAGGTNPVQGLLAAATAYDGTYTAAVDRIIDSGWGQIVEDTFDFYQPTTTVLTPRDAVAVGLNKAAGSGEYDLPNGSVAFANGRLTVGGLTVASTTQIGTGNFLTFDRNAVMFVRRMQPELRMFEDAALARRNKVMFRIEERVTMAIFNNQALVKGALAAV